MHADNVIFFPDQLHEFSSSLKTQLAKSFGCFQSKSIDEFLQVYAKTGTFILIFSEPKNAIDFLNTNRNALSKLEFKALVLLNESRIYNENLSDVLKRHKLLLINPQMLTTLEADLHKYFQGKK